MSLIGTLDSGVSALKTFEKGLEVIGNNISNVNTTGFKSSKAKYADNFSQILQSSSPSGSSGSNIDSTSVGTGVQLSAIHADYSQGLVNSTGQTTDLAISGQGFFNVRDPKAGVNYATRAGDFRIDDSGYLVTQQGYRVQGMYDGAIAYAATVVNGTLTFTPTATDPSTVGDLKTNVSLAVTGSLAGGTGAGITNSTGGAFTNAQINAAAPSLQSVSVDASGKIVAFMSNGDSFTRGQVFLQNFRDTNALTKKGNNLFTGFDAAGVVGGSALTAANNTAGTNGLGQIQSGALEQSNVDLTQEFADLITTQRSFQAGSRLLTVSDSVLEEIVNLKRS